VPFCWSDALIGSKIVKSTSYIAAPPSIAVPVLTSIPLAALPSVEEPVLTTIPAAKYIQILQEGPSAPVPKVENLPLLAHKQISYEGT
jgi:hypothetical protein